MEVQLGADRAFPRWTKESDARYNYATVEHAFMQMFALPEMQRVALRSRISYFVRLGLVAERPGTGQKIKYHEDGIITEWYIALILAHLRIDPELAVRIIKANWGKRPAGKRDDLDAAMRRGDITLGDLIPAAREADREPYCRGGRLQRPTDRHPVAQLRAGIRFGPDPAAIG